MRKKNSPTCKAWRGTVLGVLLGMSTAAVHAQDTPILDQLLEKLKDRGVMTEEEYQALIRVTRNAYSSAPSAERALRRQRTPRRRKEGEGGRQEHAGGPLSRRLHLRVGRQTAFHQDNRSRARRLSKLRGHTAANTFDVRRAISG